MSNPIRMTLNTAKKKISSKCFKNRCEKKAEKEKMYYKEIKPAMYVVYFDQRLGAMHAKRWSI